MNPLHKFARELRLMDEGFYAEVRQWLMVRCSDARFINDQFQCFSTHCRPPWFTPSSMRFTDVFGNTIKMEEIKP